MSLSCHHHYSIQPKRKHRTLKRYLSPGNMGVKVKSSANIAPIAHMSAKNHVCYSPPQEEEPSKSENTNGKQVRQYRKCTK